MFWIWWTLSHEHIKKYERHNHIKELLKKIKASLTENLLKYLFKWPQKKYFDRITLAQSNKRNNTKGRSLYYCPDDSAGINAQIKRSDHLVVLH
jgi:hypothetical protein